MKKNTKNKIIEFNTWLITFMILSSVLATIKIEWINFINGKFFLFMYIIVLTLQFTLTLKKIKRKDIVILLALALSVILNTFWNGGTFGSIVIAIASTLTLLLRRHFTFNHQQIKVIFSVSLIIFLYWAINTLNGYYDFFIDSRNELSLVNPNTIGMFILYFSLLMYFYCEKNISFINERILLKYVSLLVPLMLLLKLQNRSSFLALLFFIVGAKLKNSKTISWKIKNNLLIFTFFFILLFPFFMVRLYTKTFESSVSTGNIFSKKTIFSGREKIWLNYFRAAEKNPIKIISGFGSRVSHWEESPVGNMHNSFLAILNNHGILPYILYVISLFKSIFIFSETETMQKARFLNALVVTTFIIVAVFETNLLFVSVLLQIILLSDFTNDGSNLQW